MHVKITMEIERPGQTGARRWHRVTWEFPIAPEPLERIESRISDALHGKLQPQDALPMDIT